MPLPLHLPDQIGYAALHELDQVQWRSLEHAYGTGVQRGEQFGDVAAALRDLGDPDRAPDGIQALYANIYHQGTVYEATAYAVPFLAAVIAGAEVAPTARLELLVLLGSIAHAASRATEDGGMAGAFGEGVDELIQTAFTQCVARWMAVPALDSKASAIVAALTAVTAAPSSATYRVLREELSALATEILARREHDDHDRPIILETTGERFHHPKFGDGDLVQRLEKGLLLRFGDGKERVILERFLTKLSS